MNETETEAGGRAALHGAARLESGAPVSVEAISWRSIWPLSRPIRAGQPSSACEFVLVGLANHAGPDGTGTFLSVATLVRYTGLSERTVRTCLERLEGQGIIAPCDPNLVAARIQASRPAPDNLLHYPAANGWLQGGARRGRASSVHSWTRGASPVAGLRSLATRPRVYGLLKAMPM